MSCPMKSASGSFYSIYLQNSGRHSRPMPMEKGSLLSEISRFTLHLTVQIPGLIRSCSSFLRAVCPRQLQGFRRMPFLPPVSCGGTLFMTGNITERPGYDWWILRIGYSYRLYDIVLRRSFPWLRGIFLDSLRRRNRSQWSLGKGT